MANSNLKLGYFFKGKKSASRLEAIPKRRTSISYTVKLPPGNFPHDSSSTNQNDWNPEFASNSKDYGEKEIKDEISLGPFSFNIPKLDDEAISASHYIQTADLKLLKKKHHHPSVSLAAMLKHKHESGSPLYHHRASKLRAEDREDKNSSDNDDDNNDDDKNDDDKNDDDKNDDVNNDDLIKSENGDEDDDDNDDEEEEEDADPEEDDSDFKQNKRPVSLTGDMKIPLPENVKNEIKDERLLKAAHRHAHHRIKGKICLLQLS